MKRRTLTFAWITAFLSGAAVLVVELAAIRALAPFFGQALFVWTNVIGLVLLGLAVGNVLGGRLADRFPRLEFLCVILLAASVLVGIAAFLPAVVARALLPESLSLEASYEFLLKGSFITTLVAFVPPVLLLGAVAPFLVRCASTSIERVGTSSGLLYGAGTLGSISGTFLTTYVLLPLAGVRGSLLLAAGLLALSSVPLWLACRRGKLAVASAMTGLLAVFLARTALGSSVTAGLAQGELIAARDSRYQHVEIRRREDLNARVLALDEGCDSYHSILPDTGVLTGGYYDYFNLIAAQAIRDNQSLDVLILGFAGGTHGRQLLHFFAALPGLRIEGVELDPTVVELAREYLELPADPRLTVHAAMDARTYLRAAEKRFDLVIVDCYSQQSFLPFHLTTGEFFEEARGRLRPGGYLALNLSGYGAADPVVQAVTRTAARVFVHPLVVMRLPETINFLVYGRREAEAPLPGDFTAAPLGVELQALLERLRVPVHAWYFLDDGEGRELSDDAGWLDSLQIERLKRRSRLRLEGLE